VRVRLLVAFVVSLLLFLLVNLPIRQVYRLIQPPAGVVIEGLEGRLYSGRIQRLAYRNLEFQDLRYRLEPSCLLRLEVCYRIEDEAGDLSLRALYSPWQGVGVDAARLSLPLERLRPLMPSLLVRPTGLLELDARRIRLYGKRLSEVDATAYWREAGIEGEPQKLGDFKADIEGGGKELRMRFADLPGASVGVEGELQLTATDYRLDMELEARPELGKPARNALELLAPRSGLNRYRVKRTGRLPQPLTLLRNEDKG